MNKNLIYRKLCYETYNKIPKIPKSHRCDLANETKSNKSLGNSQETPQLVFFKTKLKLSDTIKNPFILKTFRCF